jgi:hypothetical protein
MPFLGFGLLVGPETKTLEVAVRARNGSPLLPLTSAFEPKDTGF